MIGKGQILLLSMLTVKLSLRCNSRVGYILARSIAARICAQRFLMIIIMNGICFHMINY